MENVNGTIMQQQQQQMMQFQMMVTEQNNLILAMIEMSTKKICFYFSSNKLY